MPLRVYERVDSPTLGLLDRELVQIAGRGHLRNGRRVELLLDSEDHRDRPVEGRELMVLSDG